MDKLDQLIEKFKEVREELEKSDSAELEKAFFSSWSKWGPTKKVTPAAPKPAKPTGIDKIKAVSKETITPTVVQDDKKRATKLTGIDKIKAEAQKPITPTTVKKGDDEPFHNMSPTPGKLTHPSESYRADSYQRALAGEFTPKPAAPAVKPASTAKLTGLDRIRAASQEPLKREETLTFQKNGQWNLEKTHVGFKKLQGKLEGEGHSEESAGAIAASIGRKKYGSKKMAEMAHKSETGMPEGTMKKSADGTGVVAAPKDLARVSDVPIVAPTPKITPQPALKEGLAQRATYSGRGGDTSIASDKTAISPTGPRRAPIYDYDPTVSSSSPNRHVVNPNKTIPTGYFKSPANTTGLDRIAAVSRQPIVPTTVKSEEDGRNDKAECPKCHAKQCQCNNTGVLIDKGDMDKAVNVSSASIVGTPDDSI